MLAVALAATAVPSSNFLRIASATKNGETFTIGSKVFEIWTGGALTAGRVAADLTAAATAAAATLTGTFAANLTAADTITIAGVVYTARATATGVANEFVIGATLTDTRNNLVTAAAGHATVTVTASSTNAIVATAKAKGTNGNALAVAEAAAQFSWAGAAVALAGGVDPTAAESITGIVAAINANAAGVRATAATGGVHVVDSDGGNSAIACTETLAGTNNAWENATTVGSTSPVASGRGLIPVLVSRQPSALEVTLGVMRIPLGFTPRAYLVNVVASTGIVKAWGGVRAVAGEVITLTNNGTVDFAATDTVNVFVQG